MSTLRSLRHRKRSLRDLRDVFDAMRNFALAEISRFTRGQDFRRQLIDELNVVASACAPYFLPSLTPAAPMRTLYIVIGSERGLCGDFNANVISHWAHVDARNVLGEVLVVGSALAERFPESRRTVTRMAGPASGDDVDTVLVNVLAQMALRARGGAIGLVAIAADREAVRDVAILPFHAQPAQRGVRTPQLQLAPDDFARAFVDSYVDAALHDLFATSLIAENLSRLARMTAAIDRVDRELVHTTHQANRVRQEAITQEVETLLLSSYPAPSFLDLTQ